MSRENDQILVEADEFKHSAFGKAFVRELNEVQNTLVNDMVIEDDLNSLLRLQGMLRAIARVFVIPDTIIEKYSEEVSDGS